MMAPCLLAAETTTPDIADVSPRIVGGIDANPADWKFYTQIVNRNSNRSFCGASYIGNGFVLTAAHCVDTDAPNHIAVKIGGSRYNGTDGTRLDVSQIHIHPNFNTSNLANDIALLKLTNAPAGLTAVDIASGSLYQYASDGDYLTVAGLGRTAEGGSSPSVLQEVDVPLVSDADCRLAGGNYTSIGGVSFCAGLPQGGIDSCQGDSGGPIVINRGGNVTQLGIVSWGIGCARPGKYGVYSDIAALKTFVDDIVIGGSDKVHVAFDENEVLSDFIVGEPKQHSFSVQNAGFAPFTIDRLSVSGAGVATSPVVVTDSCSQTTLLGSESCQVTIEFGASQVGTATATMTFEVDQTTTIYNATVSATANPASGYCSTDWKEDTVYLPKDTATWGGKLWKAKWWTQGQHPSTSGPWGPWEEVGVAPDCGVTTPVEPPVQPPVEPPVLPPVEPPVTPEPPTNGEGYVAGTQYSAGDIVVHNNNTYECKPWPYNLWCGAAPSAYAPGTGTNWQDAWIKR
ncbi:trypsin-like serine protease [Enterovibrio calviensis]|uniref:trypsin-like serine protease n=1 Tax=Enterovibrio calviensis TaxID=91359 RepID=UPI000685C548|nr:trypsin-like serine protease [Enterovibrio calviensis]